MNFRLTAILLGVVVVLVGGMLVAVLLDDAPAADAVLLEPFAAAKPDDIDTVEILRTEPSEQKLVFVKASGNVWELREPTAAKVESFAVQSLVADLVRLKPTPYPTIPGSLADAGLANPGVKVTLRKGTDAATLFVGDSTAGQDRAVTFVATAARPKRVVAVKRSDLDGLFKPATGPGRAWEIVKWLTDYRQRKPLGADLRDAVSDLKSVKISSGGKSFTLDRTPAGDWVFADPANYGPADLAGDPAPKPNAFTGVRQLLTFLTGLGVVPDEIIESPGPAEQYGLGAGCTRIEFVPKVGKPEVLLVGKLDEPPPPKPGEKPLPPNPVKKLFARVEGDAAVLKLPADRFDVLAKTAADPTELRDRGLIPDLKKDRIDAIDVVRNGVTTKLRRVNVGEAREWVLYGGPADPQIAAPTAPDLLDALTAPRVAKEVLNAPNDVAVNVPEGAEFRVWFDGTTPAAADPKAAPGALPVEPKRKETPPDAVIKLGKREGDFVFARRTLNGVSADLKLPEGYAAVAGRDRIGYVDARFKSFATNLAVKLAFDRNGERFEIVRSEKPDPDYPQGKWTFAKPDRLKDRVADADKVGGGTVQAAGLLGLLATMQADRVVAEGVTDWKPFGLDTGTPHLTVTVGSVGRADQPASEKERVYEFSATGDRPGFAYVRQAGRDVVFSVPAVLPKRFADDELRDLTPYRLDPAKITEVKFRGWKQAASVPVEYHFRRAGAGWETVATPAPDKWTPDAAKMGSLLAVLAAPKPQATTGGDQKPEHGFDAATANALQVTLVSPAKTVVLVLGNDAPGGGVFTWFDASPNEVLVMPPLLFRLYKEKPEYLKP